MICSTCGHTQENGNFCGKCGADLRVGSSDQRAKVLQETAAAAENQLPKPSAVSAPASDYIEKAKSASKGYFAFSKQYVKKPSDIFTAKEAEFKNGLISLILFTVLFAFTIFFFAQSIARSMLGGFGDLFMSEYAGPSFFTIFGQTFLYTAIYIVLITASIFIISKLFGADQSIKQVTAVYGTHMIPSLILILLSMLLIMMDAYTYGGILITLSILFTIVIVPIYIISSSLATKSKSIDPFYGFITYLILFSIVTAVYTGLLADSTFGSMLDQIGYYL